MSTPYPGLHSCHICRKFVLDCRPKVGYEDSHFPRPRSTSSSNRWRPPPRVQQYIDLFAKGDPKKLSISNNSFIFDITGSELKVAASEGCAFCVYALEGLRFSNHESFLAADGHTDECGPSWSFRTTIPLDNVNLNFGSSRQLLWSGSSNPDFRLVASKESAIAQAVPARPLNNFPLSESTCRWAKELLQTCLETHSECIKPDQIFCPTRLIEIVEDGSAIVLRLFESPQGHPPPPYAALSYVWGGDQRVKTTTSTVKQFQQAIELQQLPQSLQDAIRVALTLGLHMLWVDALCIIQDDEADRGREITMMTKIYTNATVTILASRAKGVEEGFLQERLRPGTAFELPYISFQGTSGSVILDPRIRVSTEPLDTRGWTLQERLLSSRVLEFGSLQTRWTCEGIRNKDYQNSVDGFLSKPFGNDEKSDELFLNVLKRISQPKVDDDTFDKNREDVLDLWYTLINAYSHRHLTRQADRILAISGIARQFGQILRDVYLAGLWLSDISSGLLWVPHNTTERDACTRKTQSPSWSWTSINSSVTFKYRHRNKPLFELVDYKIELSQNLGPNEKQPATPTTDAFGAVQSAPLRLKARLQKARWNGSAHSSLRRASSTGQYDIDVPTVVHQDFSVTTDNDGIEVYLILLGVDETNKKQDFVGLVLNHEGGDDYSRLGLFYHNLTAYKNQGRKKGRTGPEYQYQDSVTWLQEGEEQVITLI